MTLCALLLTELLTVPALAESAVPEAGKAMIGETQYNTLAEAIAAAQDGETIVLGEGLYTTYKATSPKKSLTFVGQGADKTHWGIGATMPDPAYFGTEYNGDYSFDGCTFHSLGKTINVYTDYGAGKNDITVNFKNCTVVSEKDGKKTGHAIDTENDKYTDGYKDDAFDVTETMPWTEQADGSFLHRTATLRRRPAGMTARHGGWRCWRPARQPSQCVSAQEDDGSARINRSAGKLIVTKPLRRTNCPLRGLFARGGMWYNKPKRRQNAQWMLRKRKQN